jgi:hypothetical protein
MIGQYYSIKSPTGECGELGAFVFKSNTDDLIGFVYDSYGDVGEIVLFEPMELPDNIIECFDMPCDYTEMLKKVIVRASKEVKDMWIDACLKSKDD